MLAGFCLLGAAEAGAQLRPDLPFGEGEELVYRASTVLGSVGRGSMRVAGPDEVRGHATLLLSFDFSGRMGPLRAESRARSWLCPDALASLRYQRTERSPLFSGSEAVEIYPEERRWRSAAGETGAIPAGAPLDELSFIYFIRTLPLADSAVYTLARHFAAERNPVSVRVVRRMRLRVPAGEFQAVEVEMSVKDRRSYGGRGSIRLFFTDDARRLPLRIVSSVPVVGSVTLSLESFTPGR